MSGIAETRARLVMRARGRCERCRRSLSAEWPGWSMHHRRARGMGGTKRPDVHHLSNLLALCGTGTTGCHGWVESNRFEARADGLLVSQSADPARVPVLRWGVSVLLDAGGGVTPAETVDVRVAERGAPVMRLATRHATCDDATGTDAD